MTTTPSPVHAEPLPQRCLECSARCRYCHRPRAVSVNEFSNNSIELCGRNLSLDAMLKVGLEGVFLNCQSHEISYLHGQVKRLQDLLDLTTPKIP